VNLETVTVIMKFRIIPKVPNPSGDIPNNQFSGLLSVTFTNLKYTMYASVEISPASIPEIAPCLFIFLENIPNIKIGKKDAAANPNASATTAAT
jgi:hypothetical protein